MRKSYLDSLLGKTAIAANVTVDATTFLEPGLTAAVGTNIAKVDQLTIDSAHGVIAAATDITGKTLVLIGTDAATDALSVQGTAVANVTDLSGITATNASVVYIGGKGADTVTFHTTSSSVLAQETMGDSGIYTETDSGTNPISTVDFDVITGFNAGDTIQLNSSYSGAASGLIAAAVTDSTLDSDTLTLTDNSVHIIKGTYASGTDTFIGDDSGHDALVIYDADATDSISSYEAVVIVGGGTLTATGGDAGLITFA